ncbi:MAG: MSHA biogenesis protein MshI [Alteromonadaceae bacterium]|jgi:MSHA biogenesis protein MshI
MALNTKIKNFFSKSKSTHNISVSLRQQSLAFCHIPDKGESKCQKVVNKNAVHSFSVLKKKHQLEGACQVVLSSEQYQIIQVNKPNVPESEILGALKWQVKDLVPYSPENMILDYFDGPILVGTAEKINVVCAELSVLKKIVERLKKEDLPVTMITIAEFAFAKLLPVQSSPCLLVCQREDEEILLLIVQDGHVYFHRRLRGYTQISTKSEDELAMTVIDSLSLEIQRSIDYFERQLKQAPIKSIKVIIPIANEGFLARKLAENTHIPVELLSMPAGFELQREFAVAIGATRLNGMVVDNE